VDLRCWLQDERCNNNINIHTHFDTIHTMHEDFSIMLLKPHPQSYNSYLSAIIAALSVLGTKLSPDALMLSIIDKFDHCTVKTHQLKDKGKDITIHAKSRSKKPWKSGKGLKKSIKCFNCQKKGHVKADCWVEGGGKEGQGL
jgi:hypothetical protein